MDIRSLRVKIGLTQVQFAAFAKVSQSTVSKWERGKGEPSIRHVARLVEATKGEVTPNDFLAEPATEPERASAS